MSSFLNEKEAGETGFISVRNGHFVTGTGNPIRFFGDNLTFGVCFQEKDKSTISAAGFRKLAGALFADRRYDNVFVYHNSAPSYYAARGFRGLLRI